MLTSLVLLALPLGYDCMITVQPEVLVVVDFSLHASLGGDLLTTSQYVRNFWSAVNLRFRALSNPAVELVVVGMEVGNTPYLEVKQGKVEASSALDAMGKHYFSRNKGSWDLVVTMTGLDLCQRKTMSSKCNSATAGYAYVGGACVANSRKSKVNAVALVEDDGGYGGVIVAAHEVAHLLGAAHDGDLAPRYLKGPGARSCPWTDGYIMSDRRRGVRGLSWSRCSQEQIRHFVSSPTAACLRTTSRASPSTFSLYSSSTLLAPHVSSADEQCRREAGPQSRACFSDTRLCTQLFCLNPSTGGCVAYRPAVEGTGCGKGKICNSGICKKATTTIGKVSSKTIGTVRTVSTKTIGTMFTKTTTVKPKFTKTISSKSQRKTRKETKNINRISRIQTKQIQPKSVPAKESFLPLTSFCIDEAQINVRGVRNCDNLFKSFAFMFCGNQRVKKMCCGSHALYCRS